MMTDTNWQATPELRFVERGSIKNTLQQKWQTYTVTPNSAVRLISEWRDVPLTKENDDD
jgi:hypothetical protein